MSGFQVTSPSLYMKLNRDIPREMVDLEYVDDNILRVVVYMDTQPKRIQNCAWIMADAVEKVALKLDAEPDETFAAFSLVFEQAMMMVRARGLSKRKRDAQR